MPLQKEVIHLAIGTLPHHVTTHFFNQQASHFDYQDGAGRSTNDEHKSASSSSALLDPSIDFQEGIGALSGQPTFFPRQVVVDFRDNFGRGWEAYNAVFGEGERDGDDGIEGGYSESMVLPDRAAEEGLHAWHSPAEVQFVGGEAPSKRRAFLYDDDESDEDVREEEDEAKTASSIRQSETSATSPEEGYVETKENSTNEKERKSSAKSVTPQIYAHNAHHPRGVRALPRHFQSGTLTPMFGAVDEGQVPLSSFEMGITLARDMERNASLFDEHIRWYAEDSDLLQSFQLYASVTDGCAGLSHETLQLLSDEFPKTPVMTWGLATTAAATEDPESQQARLRRTNEILSLWSLSSSSLYVPIQVPDQLTPYVAAPPTSHLKSHIDWSLSYNAAALMSSFIDTAMLPSRLHDEARRRPVAALVSTLNWRRDTPIASLGGCMPTPLLAPIRQAPQPLDPIEALLASRGYDTRKRERQGLAPYESASERAERAASILSQNCLDLSRGRASQAVRRCKAFAQWAVARDGDAMANAPTREALEALVQLDEPSGRVDVLPLSLNVQSASLPQLFRNLTSSGRPLFDQQSRSKVQSVPMMASLATTPATAELLASARSFVDERLVRGHDPLFAYGLGGARGRGGAGQAASDETEGPLGGRDGMQEVRERLEELLGAYDDGSARLYNGDDDRVGTDEEVDAGGDESDWDLGE